MNSEERQMIANLFERLRTLEFDGEGSGGGPVHSRFDQAISGRSVLPGAVGAGSRAGTP